MSTAKILFDTDVLIFIQKGFLKAGKLVEEAHSRAISTQTYIEVLQGAQNKKQHITIQRFLKDFNFQVLPFTENIGHRASIYVEEFALSNSMRAGDAIIAATAIENQLPLCTANLKHLKVVKELTIIPLTLTTE